MIASRSFFTPRKLLIAWLALGLFVLLDIALFGWLIFRTLSEREVNEILLDTQGEMETLAAKIEEKAEQHGGDLYTAVATETETLTYIDSVLRGREIITTVEIQDAEGTLVRRIKSEQQIPVRDGPEPGGEAGTGPADPFGGTLDREVRDIEPVEPDTLEERELGGGELRQESASRTDTFDVTDLEIPIGDLGFIQIGISRNELEGRIAVLRRELVRQTSAVGGVTLVIFFVGYLAIWFLLRRSRRLEEQAADAERMAYIGTLASGLAHEIRNPLNSLNLNMQLLQEEMGDCAPTPSGPRLLSITRSEISRLERLVTDFLSYARPRPLELEEVPVAELLEEARTLALADARRYRARLEVEDQTGGLAAHVDPGQVRQLLLNLTQNALAATEEVERPAVVRLEAHRQGQQLRLEVRDNGMGVPEEARERMFDLFYSTRRGGTGLGLAIVQRIVKDHGGRIEVESEPGEGTTMRVFLPLAWGQEAAGREPEPARSPA